MGHRYVSEVTNCDKKPQIINLWLFVTICDFRHISMPHENRQFRFSIQKTAPIISGNFVMKSRFACADAFSVRKHTNTFFTDRPFCFCNGFSGQNLENSTNTVLKKIEIELFRMVQLRAPSDITISAGYFDYFELAVASGYNCRVDQSIK